MARYYKRDEMFFPISESQYAATLDKLPPGNYVIKTGLSGFFFAQYEKEFDLGPKIYGNAMARAERIINTFLDRSGSTGVLLSGEKGSGKTMLGKLICKILAERHGIPTIFITEPWSGDAFMEFMGSINQPAVVFFDEVEKVYNGTVTEQHGDASQTHLLTLLDGIFTTQKLYILTCNDKMKIDEFMINRPGRIFYAFDFEGLEEDFIRQYCADNLKKADAYLEDVVKVASFFKHFNFDQLKAIVEEVNRYDERPQDTLDYLNINPASDYSQYDCQLIPAGLERPLVSLSPNVVNNPLTDPRSRLGFYTYELPAKYLKERNARIRGKQVEPAPHPPKFVDLNQVGISATAYDGPAESYTLDAEDYNDETGEGRQTSVSFSFGIKDIRRTSRDGFELVNDHGDRLLLKKQEFKYDWRAL